MKKQAKTQVLKVDEEKLAQINEEKLVLIGYGARQLRINQSGVPCSDSRYMTDTKYPVLHTALYTLYEQASKQGYTCEKSSDV